MGIDLTQLEGLSKEDLQNILGAAKRQMGEIQEKEQSKREEEYVRELAPYREQLDQLENGVKAVAGAYDAKIEKLKDEKKDKVAAARKEIEEYLGKYNEFRKSKGLPSASITTRRRSGGKQHAYGLVWPNESADCSEVRITVDDGEPSKPIDLSEGTPIGPIKEALESAGVPDETGGRARGLVNRIKKQMAQRKEKSGQPVKIS
jgi:uncharacterized protein YhaN